MPDGVRLGVRIACDPGKARIGIARTDPRGTLAVPDEAVPAGDGAYSAVRALVVEYEAIVVYVGLPLRLDGTRGPAADWAREWADGLADVVGVPVRLVDERLTTVEAQRGLHAAGRTAKSSRAVIDSASACILLESCLNAEQATGVIPGEPVRVDEVE